MPALRGRPGRGPCRRGPLLDLPAVARAVGGRRPDRGCERWASPGGRPRDAGTHPGVPGRTLSPIGTGVVAPVWAMPADLLRQAARRLRLAAAGVVLSLAASIVLNNLVEASGWHTFNLLAFKNVILAFMVAASAAVVWFTHSGRLGPTRLLRVSLGYQIAVALAISISDHLEPLRADVPFLSISWLCVFIVMFPLVVPACAALGTRRRAGLGVDLAARLLRGPGARRPGGSTPRAVAERPRGLFRRGLRHVLDDGDPQPARAGLLPARREARPRGHGRGVARATPHARPAGGDQAHPT